MYAGCVSVPPFGGFFRTRWDGWSRMALGQASKKPKNIQNQRDFPVTRTSSTSSCPVAPRSPI